MYIYTYANIETNVHLHHMCVDIYIHTNIYIYIYDPSAWTPNSLFNAIIVLQSFCNLCYASFAFLCFLSSDCKKHYKTCAFCNILLKMLENHLFSLVSASRVLENLVKPVLFAIFC